MWRLRPCVAAAAVVASCCGVVSFHGSCDWFGQRRRLQVQDVFASEADARHCDIVVHCLGRAVCAFERGSRGPVVVE